jgi:hypothetical protein
VLAGRRNEACSLAGQLLFEDLDPLHRFGGEVTLDAGHSALRWQSDALAAVTRAQVDDHRPLPAAGRLSHFAGGQRFGRPGEDALEQGRDDLDRPDEESRHAEHSDCGAAVDGPDAVGEQTALPIVPWCGPGGSGNHRADGRECRAAAGEHEQSGDETHGEAQEEPGCRQHSPANLPAATAGERAEDRTVRFGACLSNLVRLPPRRLDIERHAFSSPLGPGSEVQPSTGSTTRVQWPYRRGNSSQAVEPSQLPSGAGIRPGERRSRLCAPLSFSVEVAHG